MESFNPFIQRGNFLLRELKLSQEPSHHRSTRSAVLFGEVGLHRCFTPNTRYCAIWLRLLLVLHTQLLDLKQQLPGLTAVQTVDAAQVSHAVALLFGQQWLVLGERPQQFADQRCCVLPSAAAGLHSRNRHLFID